MKDSKENSKNKVQLFIAVSLLVIIIIGAITGTVLFLSDNDGHKPATQNKPLFGVWWWDNRLDSSYLDFAEENGVTEIYCYYSSFGQKTTDFIKSASEKNIDVLWLAGKYEWIEDYDSLKAKVGEFLDFQQSSEYKFKGIHLDIEPHQHPEFDQKREDLITAFAKLTLALKRDYPDVRIEYDIPFWLEDEVTVHGITKPAYEFVIDNAYRVTMMSYRDSAEKILDCAKEEIGYAKSVGKPLNLSVETGENEDIVTFYEEGSAYMFGELSAVRKALPDNFGIAIHHIKDWRELKK